MDKVKKPTDSEWCTPSSEAFRFYSNRECFIPNICRCASLKPIYITKPIHLWRGHKFCYVVDQSRQKLYCFCSIKCHTSFLPSYQIPLIFKQLTPEFNCSSRNEHMPVDQEWEVQMGLSDGQKIGWSNQTSTDTTAHAQETIDDWNRKALPRHVGGI
jgi:hypothetical protein